MTTYKSYQEAKIANPSSDIWVDTNGNFGLREVIARTIYTMHQCVVSDHCMTVEKFLADGNEFLEGDVITDGMSNKEITSNITHVMNKAASCDAATYILRAAALENQMNIDKVETQSEEAMQSESLVDVLKDFRSSLSKSLGVPESELSKPIPKATETQTEHQEEMSELSGEVEWNGEGLPPVGAIYTTEPNFEIELLCKYSSEYVVVGEMLPRESYKGMEVVIDLMEQRNRTFRKPETPQQREERERLESAYELYLIDFKKSGSESFNYNQFCKDDYMRNFWLAIVDKTKYRKVVK